MYYKKSVEEEEQAKQLTHDIKEQFKKPSPLPLSKAPTGKGASKNDQLIQRLAFEFNFDPVAELVKLAKSNRVSSDLRAKISMEFMQYFMPKMKAIDTNPNQGEVININILPPDGTNIQTILTKNEEYRNDS